MSALPGTASPTLPTTSSPVVVITPILPLPITPPTSSSTTPSTSLPTSLSSSTSASSASSDSKSTSSSTTSASSSTTSASSSTPTTSRSSITSLSSTTNLPAVITEVSTTFVSESQTLIPTAAASSKNNTGNAFFENKGAVAGVFSVVGLIGLVILIALIINIIRRREAKKFDKELFLATQEAAATAPNLNFLDDEDDEPKHNGYSDVSHGTYGQPQMDAFMRGPSVGEIYPPYAGNGAGIGAHARAERAHGNAHYDPYAALQGGSAYPPFVLSPGDTYGGPPPGRGNELGAAIIPSGQPYPQRSPPPDLGRSRSTSTAATQPSTQPSPHTANYPQPPYPVDVKPTPSLPNQYTEQSTRKVEPPTDAAADDDAAYGGYVEDDVEEEVPKRVLKIANES